MGTSYVASQRKICPAPLLAENSIEDIARNFLFP